jgi:Tfp pilus assembly protein PilF
MPRVHYGQALAIAVGVGSPIEEARALEGIGRCQLRSGREREAITLLSQSLAIYDRIGSPNAQRVQTTLHESGE